MINYEKFNSSAKLHNIRGKTHTVNVYISSAINLEVSVIFMVIHHECVVGSFCG